MARKRAVNYFNTTSMGPSIAQEKVPIDLLLELDEERTFININTTRYDQLSPKIMEKLAIPTKPGFRRILISLDIEKGQDCNFVITSIVESKNDTLLGKAFNLYARAFPLLNITYEVSVIEDSFWLIYKDDGSIVTKALVRMVLGVIAKGWMESRFRAWSSRNVNQSSCGLRISGVEPSLIPILKDIYTTSRGVTIFTRINLPGIGSSKDICDAVNRYINTEFSYDNFCKYVYGKTGPTVGVGTVTPPQFPLSNLYMNIVHRLLSVILGISRDIGASLYSSSYIGTKYLLDKCPTIREINSYKHVKFGRLQHTNIGKPKVTVSKAQQQQHEETIHLDTLCKKSLVELSDFITTTGVLCSPNLNEKYLDVELAEVGKLCAIIIEPSSLVEGTGQGTKFDSNIYTYVDQSKPIFKEPTEAWQEAHREVVRLWEDRFMETTNIMKIEAALAYMDKGV